MPGTFDSPRRFSLRQRLPELLIEGASVAFAVLLALAVDQWRESKSNDGLAERAEQSILAEVRTNLGHLEDQAHHRDSLIAYTREVRASLVDGADLDGINVNVSPALLTRTAWETAQVTRALHFMDYDRVAQIGRIYEIQVLYEDAEDALVRLLAGGLSQLNWDEPVEAIDVILPALVRVDTFGDLLTRVFAAAAEGGFEAMDKADSVNSEAQTP